MKAPSEEIYGKSMHRTYTVMLKSSISIVYNDVADNMGSIFINLAAVASKICEIPRNSLKIRTYSSSRSSKVIDLVLIESTLLISH